MNVIAKVRQGSVERWRAVQEARREQRAGRPLTPPQPPVQRRDPRNQRPRYCVLLFTDSVFSFKFFPPIFIIVQSKST